MDLVEPGSVISVADSYVPVPALPPNDLGHIFRRGVFVKEKT